MRAVPCLVVIASLCAASGGCCSMGLGNLSPRPAAAYQAKTQEVREDAPPDFTVVAAPPFVVAGDGPPELVRADATEVVSWAADALRKDFFPREPNEIVVIWRLDTEESYYRSANALFGDIPETPYGYFSPCDRAIVVNGALGNGTLVHEMVHVLMEANFPDAPIWYDEGLASLFEQPIERDGHILGDTNWRLAGLQAALEVGWRPAFSRLLAMSRSEFYYEELRNRNYAVARYLLYYLQVKGKLITFHQRFLRDQREDPTGRAFLEQTLGIARIDQLTEPWTAFILEL